MAIFNSDVCLPEGTSRRTCTYMYHSLEGEWSLRHSHLQPFFMDFKHSTLQTEKHEPKQAQRTQSEILREIKTTIRIFGCFFLQLFLCFIGSAWGQVCNCVYFWSYSFFDLLGLWHLLLSSFIAEGLSPQIYRIRSFRESLKLHRHWADLDHYSSYHSSYHSSFSHDFPIISHDFPHDLMAIGHWCPQEALAAKRKLMLLVRSHPEAQGFWAVTEHGLYCNNMIHDTWYDIWYDIR